MDSDKKLFIRTAATDSCSLILTKDKQLSKSDPRSVFKATISSEKRVREGNSHSKTKAGDRTVLS